MSEAVYTQHELKIKLEPIFISAPIKKAILFGSYARGLQTATSDIDIIIDSKGRVRGIDFFSILEDITVCLDKRIDLIEMYEIQKDSPIYQAIEQEGVVLFE